MSEAEKIMKFSDEKLAEIAPVIRAMVDGERDIKSFAVSELEALGFEPNMEVPPMESEEPVAEAIVEEIIKIEGVEK